MTNIIGFAGKAQSGKNTSCNFIIGHSMFSLGICREFKITPQGRLWVSDIFGDTNNEGIFDVTDPSPIMKDFLATHLNEYVKLYSFADALKQKVCIEILGLSHQQCFGTDADKNSLTKLRWEDMPGVVTDFHSDIFNDIVSAHENPGTYPDELTKLTTHAPGLMTAREVMQFVGTEIFRKMYQNVWVDACIRQIQSDSPIIALICDVRFPNEADGILDNDGILVQLTKCVRKGDLHDSETALNNYTRIPHVIVNDTMSISEQNQEVFNILKKVGLILDQ